MPHHLLPAAVEALARMQRIVDAGRADLDRMPQKTARRDMERVLVKAEAQRDRLAHAVKVLAAFPARPEG